MASSSLLPSSQMALGTDSTHRLSSGRVAELGRMKNGRETWRCSCTAMRSITNWSPSARMLEEELCRRRCEKNAVPTDVGRSSSDAGLAGGWTSRDHTIGSNAAYVVAVNAGARASRDGACRQVRLWACSPTHERFNDPFGYFIHCPPVPVLLAFAFALIDLAHLLPCLFD